MSGPSENLAAFVRTHVDRDEVIEICRNLVRTPSENPPGDEREIAATSERLLANLGLGAEFVEPLPGRMSTISTWGEGPGRTLLFNGHYDVVPALDPAGWPHPPYSGHVEGGKLYGRGSSDMKSGIAACLGAVAALKRAGFEPAGRLVMHFVADEEALGTHGTKFLVANGYCDGATESLVGEPTGMHLVTSERGAVWLRITTEGVSAHGSSPRLGVNAVDHMSRIVRVLSEMRFKKLHEMLGAPTVNVGTIHGGSKVNMVPDRCVIEVDRRTLPGESLEEVVGEIEQIIDTVRQDVPDLKARVEVDDWAEASETPEETSLVGLLTEARDALGIEGSEVGYAGATDARFLINQAKIPSIIFGPGDLYQAHTTGEHVDVELLVQATQAYAHAFVRFLGAD